MTDWRLADKAHLRKGWICYRQHSDPTACHAMPRHAPRSFLVCYPDVQFALANGNLFQCGIAESMRLHSAGKMTKGMREEPQVGTPPPHSSHSVPPPEFFSSFLFLPPGQMVSQPRTKTDSYQLSICYSGWFHTVSHKCFRLNWPSFWVHFGYWCIWWLLGWILDFCLPSL